MKTPGLKRENEVKPAATWEIESMGDALEAKEAAAALYSGVCAGNFGVAADLGTQLMWMGSLLSPHHNETLRLLLSPFIAIAGLGFRFNIRRIARKHVK